MERVAVFIDGSNFYHGLKSTFDMEETDFGADKFEKLIKELTKDKLLVGTFYYNASLDRSKNEHIYWKQQNFFNELRRLPLFNLIFCRMRKNRDGSYSVKGDDIHLAVDLVSLGYENFFDAAILISGDGDFVPAIQKTQKLGKRIENVYFACSSSSHLKKICNKSFLIDSFLEKIAR